MLPAAAEELAEMPPGLRGRMLRLISLVEAYGLQALVAPHGRQIDGKLWEMRVTAAEGNARGFYVALQGKRLVVLHVFAKKTQKTPKRAIELAIKRMQEVG